MRRSRHSRIRGRICIPGRADIHLLHRIKIKNIGRRFSDKAFLVTGIRHRVDQTGWLTDIQFGLTPDWFCHQDGIAEEPAAGLLPPISGLHIAVVVEHSGDPPSKHHVRVKLPAIGHEVDNMVWARLAMPSAGADHGCLFVPEPGDHVVVGFLNDDPRCPVILGSILRESNNENNKFEGTASEAIGTNAKKTALHIKAKGEKPKEILLDGDSLTIAGHGNSLTMSKDGIQIKSEKRITLESENLEID